MNSTRNMATYRLRVLGCKVNQYEAGKTEGLLKILGLLPARRNEEADLVILHSCAVTGKAVQKTRQQLRRLCRRNPGATAILSGCSAREELTRELSGLARRVPAGEGWFQRLADQLRELLELSDSRDWFPPENKAIFPEFGNKTRAFIKIQDGCDIGCSYCIVPTLRGRPRDTPPESALREARHLVEKGYKEIVITGVCVGLYGQNADYSLADLLGRLADIPGLERIRMSSLHPAELTEDLLDVWAQRPQIMDHIHLSLQSGADEILQAMERGYTQAEFRDAVERSRKKLDRPSITTDIIVGFPGETETSFERSRAFCQEIGFAGMHIFKFSPRPGTRANGLPGQVNQNQIQRRSEEMQILAKEMATNFGEGFVGEKFEVLAESFDNDSGLSSGFGRRYIPVHFPGKSTLEGRIVSVTIERSEEGVLYGKLDGVQG